VNDHSKSILLKELLHGYNNSPQKKNNKDVAPEENN
jgi:hypothetical protein